MRVFFLFLGLLLLINLSGAGECDLDRKKLEEILKDNYGVTVESIAQLKDLCFFEVVVITKDKKVPVYVSGNLNYLFVGELIDLKTRKNLTKDKVVQLKLQSDREKLSRLKQYVDIEKLDSVLLSSLQLIDLPSEPENLLSLGSGEKKVYVITDPECPYCKRLHESIKGILKDRKDVQFRFVFLPLSFHRYAKSISKTILCKKDISILEKAYENQMNPEGLKKLIDSSCDDSILLPHREFSVKVGARGTPTLIFQIEKNKGLLISGALSKEKINSILDSIKVFF